jgi:hypothetical protein
MQDTHLLLATSSNISDNIARTGMTLQLSITPLRANMGAVCMTI